MTKLPEEYPLPPPNIEITGLTLEKLIRAYRRVLARAADADRADQMASREIRRDAFTISGCILSSPGTPLALASSTPPVIISLIRSTF